MDAKLKEHLKKWSEQIEILKRAALTYKQLKGSEDTLEAMLTLKVVTENKITITEKKLLAKSSKDWEDFQAGLAVAEVEYNREKNRLDLLKKVFDAEYLDCKQEFEVIHKRNPQ